MIARPNHFQGVCGTTLCVVRLLDRTKLGLSSPLGVKDVLSRELEGMSDLRYAGEA